MATNKKDEKWEADVEGNGSIVFVCGQVTQTFERKETKAKGLTAVIKNVAGMAGLSRFKVSISGREVGPDDIAKVGLKDVTRVDILPYDKAGQ